MTGPTRRLAAFLAANRRDSLPPETIAAAKTCLLDLLGCILGARESDEARIAAGTVRMLGGTPESSAIGHGFRTSCQNAALLNSLAGHVLELDDTHIASLTHAGAPVVPAALAMAERQGGDGPQLLAAIVLGYEACLRIARVVQPFHWKAGFLTMGTCGAFGAAAAAGHCLGLDGKRLANAFGLAGMQASSTNASSYGYGDMGRRLSPSHAAGAGVLSALLAEGGFTGTETILEGRNGFLQCFADGADPAPIVADLGSDWMILRNGLKPYSCNRFSHSPIDALFAVRQRMPFAPGDVRDVLVETFGAAVTNRPNRTVPETLFDAKGSIPFCLAVACVRGAMGERDFREDCLHDEALQAFAARVRCVASPAMTADFPRLWQARVTVTLTDGRVLDQFVRYPKGEPEAPMTAAEVERKFTDLATLSVAAGTAAETIAEVDRLDRAENLERLTTLLRG